MIAVSIFNNEYTVKYTYAVILSSVVWFLISKYVNSAPLLYCCPKRIRQALLSDAFPKKKALLVNGTAWIHAVMVSIPALIGVVAYWQDRFSERGHFTSVAETPYYIYQYCLLVSSGYFVWDLWICYNDFAEYGISFIAHALISLIGVMTYVMDDKPFNPWLICAMIATEISTIALHYRWAMIQGNKVVEEELTANGESETTVRGYNMLVQMANASFALLYIGYRIVFSFGWTIFPFIFFVVRGSASDPVESWNPITIISRFDRPRAMMVSVVAVLLWACLTVYWFVLLVISQCRRSPGPRPIASS